MRLRPLRTISKESQFPKQEMDEKEQADVSVMSVGSCDDTAKRDAKYCGTAAFA
jgi:hypothetical protein